MKINDINAGDFKYKIDIYSVKIETDTHGFQSPKKTLVMSPYASIKTTKGILLIKDDTDFEKALTNFTIRYPRTTVINRDMIITFRGKDYTIEYLNNVDEANILLEIQAKEITH